MKATKVKNIFNMQIGGGIKPDSLAVMCSQFSVILGSGLNLPECTKLIGSQMKKGRLKDILLAVSQDIDAGIGIAAALEKNGRGQLPVSFIETVRAGEKAGRPGEAFESLASYYDGEAKKGRKIKNALIYPAFVLLVAIGVLIVLMTNVLPKLTDIFNNMEGDLPLITEILMGASSFMAGHIFEILIGIGILVLGIFLWIQTDKGRKVKDRLMLRLPLPGKVLTKNCQADFSGTLSLLLKSGVTMNEALGITSRVMSSSIFRSACIDLRKKTEAGRSLGREMSREGCFEDMLCNMVSIGEETGELERMLDYCSLLYRDEADNAAKSVLAMLEPALLIVCSAFAGFIAFAIYIPLFSMYELF